MAAHFEPLPVDVSRTGVASVEDGRSSQQEPRPQHEDAWGADSGQTHGQTHGQTYQNSSTFPLTRVHLNLGNSLLLPTPCA